MAASKARTAVLVLALSPLLSSAFCPSTSYLSLPLSGSPLLSPRIGRVGAPSLREKSARSVGMKLSWHDRLSIEVAHAFHHEQATVHIYSSRALCPAVLSLH